MSSNARTRSTSPSAPVKRAPSPPRHPRTPAAPRRALPSPPSSPSPTPSPTSAARTSVFDLALTLGPLVVDWMVEGNVEAAHRISGEHADTGGLPLPSSATTSVARSDLGSASGDSAAPRTPRDSDRPRRPDSRSASGAGAAPRTPRDSDRPRQPKHAQLAPLAIPVVKPICGRLPAPAPALAISHPTALRTTLEPTTLARTRRWRAFARRAHSAYAVPDSPFVVLDDDPFAYAFDGGSPPQDDDPFAWPDPPPSPSPPPSTPPSMPWGRDTNRNLSPRAQARPPAPAPAPLNPHAYTTPRTAPPPFLPAWRPHTPNTPPGAGAAQEKEKGKGKDKDKSRGRGFGFSPRRKRARSVGPGVDGRGPGGREDAVRRASPAGVRAPLPTAHAHPKPAKATRWSRPAQRGSGSGGWDFKDCDPPSFFEAQEAGYASEGGRGRSILKPFLNPRPSSSAQ
ncbi:hypothetical protein JB92DRAFT_3110772 [Gautieria morchelliformis]|nr:hypothetical protein JB92DRAFT_3110772 [Gautieria morchelliformis]